MDKPKKAFDICKKPLDKPAKPFGICAVFITEHRKPCAKCWKPFDGLKVPFGERKIPFSTRGIPFDERAKPLDKCQEPAGKSGILEADRRGDENALILGLSLHSSHNALRQSELVGIIVSVWAMRIRGTRFLCVLAGVVFIGACSGPPSRDLAALKAADSGVIIDYRDGVEYSVPLSRADVEHILNAAAQGKLVGKETRDLHFDLAIEGDIRLFKGTNLLGNIPFSFKDFYITNSLYRDETGVFESLQSRLRLATPTTNAPVR